MPNSSMEVLSDEQTTREKILFLLKTHGPMTVRMLSETLGVTPMGIRRHLTSLELDKLVMHRQEHKPVGRPTYYFNLTEEAENLFPKRYDTLALHLLEVIQDEYGEEGVNAVAEKAIHREMEGVADALGSKTGAQRVEALVNFLDQHGFISSWKETEPGTFEIYQYNCPFLAVSLRFPMLCNPMPIMLKELFPGADIEVTSICTEGTNGLYRISYKENLQFDTV